MEDNTLIKCFERNNHIDYMIMESFERNNHIDYMIISFKTFLPKLNLNFMIPEGSSTPTQEQSVVA